MSKRTMIYLGIFLIVVGFGSMACSLLQKSTVILEDATFFKDEFVSLYDEAVYIIKHHIKIGVVADDGSVTMTYPHAAIVRLREIKVEAETLYKKLIEEIRDYDPSIDTLIALIRKLVSI